MGQYRKAIAAVVTLLSFGVHQALGWDLDESTQEHIISAIIGTLGFAAVYQARNHPPT